MAISVPADIEARIRDKVERGEFADVGEVMREAMRLLDEQDRHLAWLRGVLRSGLDQLDRGEGVPFTPALVAEMRRDADERFARGERPKPDVVP